MEIATTLKYKLRAPTINSWVNRLCKQWDMWISIARSDVPIRFKNNDNEVYFIIYIELLKLEMVDTIYRFFITRYSNITI